MALSGPVARAAGLILLLSLLASTAQAQLPGLPADARESSYGFAIYTPNSFVEINYLGNALIPLIVEDVSRDSLSQRDVPVGSQTSPTPHTVRLSATIMTPDARGWQVLVGDPTIYIVGGQVFESSLLIATTPEINVARIDIEVQALFEASNGYTQNRTINLSAQVARYDLALVMVGNPTASAGQFEQVRFEVNIQNLGVYPDSYQISASGDKPGFQVIAPPNVYVAPLSSATVNVTVLTPKGKPYELGQNALVMINVDSTTGGGSYPVMGTLRVRGPYMSSYWLPLVLVGLASAGILARERSQRAEMARLEKGLPRRVEPTARQAVLLAELKRKDPEAYKQKRSQLDALYASRREKYRGERKDRVARDREEHRQARTEMREEKRRLAQEKALAKKRAKAERKEAKAQARLDAKAAKAQAKLDKKQAKQLGKKRAVLEKQKAKLEKKAAKQAAKDAKLQAKADKAAAKQAKREARQREKSR